MRGTRRLTISGAGLAAIAVVAMLASGCGYGGVASASDHPDPQNGQTLFVSSCGSCHTLQAAGTSGTIGPNLDNAFAMDRSEGYQNTSIENVVLDQIRLGSGPIATYTRPEHGVKGLTPQPTMPANVVTGQDAIDVAAYVASVAGAGGISSAPPSSLGKGGAAIFKSSGCSSCHTFSAAGSTATIGPNLNTAPAMDAKADGNMNLAAFIKESITSPDAYIAKGFTGGIMPTTFGSSLSAKQLNALVAFILASTSK